MDKWVEGKDGRKVLNKMYDFCEKCQWLFHGYKCPDCGIKNTRVGTINEKGGEDNDEQKNNDQ